MFDRIAAGFRAAGSCWDVLKSDKRLVVFPLLSGIAGLLVLASFAVPIYLWKPAFLHVVGDEQVLNGDVNVPPVVYVIAFAFYFCNYFVIYFFNAALIHCALERFRGNDCSPADGLAAAGQRLPQLLAWSFVSATVGMILKAIESSHEKLGEIISAVLGAGWTVLTYFVVPVLVVERVGPIDAVKRSAKILSRTWGQAVGGQIGIGWALLPFWLLGVLALILGGFAFTKSVAVGVAVLAVTVLYFLILGLVDATLKGILLAALYLFAKSGEVPAEFDRSALEGSFAAKA